jgi:hypothetical protein
LPARVAAHVLEHQRVLGLAEKHTHLGQRIGFALNTQQFSGLFGQGNETPEILHKFSLRFCDEVLN